MTSRWRGGALGLVALLLPLACTDDTTATTVEGMPHGSCDPEDVTEGVLSEAAIDDFADRIAGESPGEILYARVPCDDGSFDEDIVLVVAEPPGGGRTGAVMSDYNHDGRFIIDEAEGVDQPLYESATGASAFGYVLFSNVAFAFASTTEQAGNEVVLRAGGSEERVAVDRYGISDLTLAWEPPVDGEGTFTIEWLDVGGAVVDTLTGEFLGTVD